MTELTHVSLFSGIGGIDIAAHWAGFETVLFCENNEFCQKVLRKNFPGVPIIGDIRDVTRESAKEPITLISGGPPCQAASVAGKQRGEEDDRWLWPETFRVVREIRPTWCVFENVKGLLTLDGGLVFDNLLSEMEGIGYEVEPYIIPACAVDAHHRRDRVFIVAHNGISQPVELSGGFTECRNGTSKCGEDVADTENSNRRGADGTANPGRGHKEVRGCSISRDRQEYRPTQPGLGRVVDGIPHWMDDPSVSPTTPRGERQERLIPRVAQGQRNRVARLKALGNAVVPQQIAPILRYISEIEGIEVQAKEGK